MDKCGMFKLFKCSKNRGFAILFKMGKKQWKTENLLRNASALYKVANIFTK